MHRLRGPIAASLIALAACAPDSVDPLAPGAPSLDRPASPTAGPAVVTVTEDDVTRQAENTAPTDDWVLYTRAGTPATAGAFEVGPSSPPEGAGSFHSATASGTQKVFLFNYDHVGASLSMITGLGYSTYRSAGQGSQLPALNIQIDHNGSAPGGFSTLVYEPVYNNASQPIATGQWQSWNAYAGRWWSTQPLAGQCAGASNGCFRTLAQIAASNPQAVITGGFGINQGSGNPGLVGATDALHIAFGSTSVTYDFEAYRVAETRDDCKDGGWRQVRTADGAAFRNQGQCVAYTSAS